MFTQITDLSGGLQTLFETVNNASKRSPTKMLLLLE